MLVPSYEIVSVHAAERIDINDCKMNCLEYMWVTILAMEGIIPMTSLASRVPPLKTQSQFIRVSCTTLQT